MFTLVIGGSASGKSEYAENLVLEMAGRPRLYIATMLPWDQECRDRIGRHQQARRGKGFSTLERHQDLAGLWLPQGAGSILLECVSNLVANELYLDGRDTADQVVRGVNHLKNHAKDLVVVTNNVFADWIPYSQETRRYCQVLGQVNCQLGAMADRVAEVAAGIPLAIKGDFLLGEKGGRE